MATYSHSKLSTFQQCKYKYKLRYIKKIKTDRESIEAFLGKTVHEALDKLYADLQFEKRLSGEELLKYFDMRWQEKWHDGVFIVKEYAPENYQAMGRKFLDAYYRHYHPFDQLRTVALETADFLPLAHGNSYHIRIDRLASDKEGNYYICDYKTSGSPKLQEDLDQDRQLALYSLWVRKNYPHAHAIKLVWHFLAADQEMISERNAEQLAALQQETESIITDVERCASFPTNVTPLCHYCEYKPQCPAWKHETALAEQGNDFSNDEGARLVDRYEALDIQEKSAAAEKEQIKGKLIEFAQKLGIGVIFGSTMKASIRSFDKVSYPHDDRFIALLKEKGVYDSAAALNSQKISSLLRKGMIDDSVRKQLTITKGWRVGLLKK